MLDQPSQQPKLVLVGGGHSHAIALLQWIKQPLTNVQLILISDRPSTPYSGMLPGYLAGLYSFEDCHIDLQALASAAGTTLISDHVVGLDLDRRLVHCQSQTSYSFDWLSIDIGIQPNLNPHLADLKGVLAIKPIDNFLQAWQAWLMQLEQQKPAEISVGIVGGGIAGVEVSLATQAYLQRNFPASDITVHLWQRGDRLLPQQSASLRCRVLNYLKKRSIAVHTNAEIIGAQAVDDRWQPQLQASSVIAENPPVLCDRLLWMTEATAAPWLASSGLATDEKGFILIDDCLRSRSHPFVFATGDIATNPKQVRPKAGVYAVRQGLPLFHNLQAVLRGQAPKPVHLQRQALVLIGTGTGQAIAAKGRWSAGPTSLIWCWKHWIDRRFMQPFYRLRQLFQSNG